MGGGEGEANEEVNSSAVTGRNGGDGTLRLEVARVDVVDVVDVVDEVD